MATLKNSRFLCIHCERVNVIKKPVPQYQGCLHAGCDGKSMDLFPWADIRENVKQFGHAYPAMPEHGARFALYPAKQEAVTA